MRMNSKGNFAYDYRSGAYKHYKTLKKAEDYSDTLYPIIVEIDTEAQTFKVVKATVRNYTEGE